MTNEEKQVADWMVAFGQEVPDKPTIPSWENRQLRAKLELEEVLELIVEGLGVSAITIGGDVINLGAMLRSIKKGVTMSQTAEGPSMASIADGCADLMVVTLGTKAACGLISNPTNSGTHPSRLQDPIFNEVMRSNWTKLWTDKEIMVEFFIEEIKQSDTAFTTRSGHDIKLIKPDNQRCWLVMDASGKVIKSPSTEQPNLEQFIK